MTKSTGKVFEEEFMSSLPDNIFKYRLPDPANSFGQDSAKLRFSKNNPFDFMIYDTHNLYCLELKSSTTSSFSYPTIEESNAIINYKALLSDAKRRKDESDTLTHKSNLQGAKKAIASRNIKEHQIEGLLEAHKRNCKSYFIFNFSKSLGNLTLAVEITDFIKFRNNNDKKSINTKDMIAMPNTLIIDNELKSKRKGAKKMLYHLEDIGIDVNLTIDTILETL